MGNIKTFWKKNVDDYFLLRNFEINPLTFFKT